MENALRVFAYIILKNQAYDKWTNTMLQLENGQQTIANIAKIRMEQAEGYGYLGYPIYSPLMYLNSGELTRLMFSDAQWKIFKNYFKGKKEIIKTKFDEIGTVRNSLAHFRPIKIDDIELIKQNIKHAFLGIEKCLKEITTISNIVPTNTEMDWYESLSKLNNEICKIQLYQSNSEEWVRIEINYSCAILNMKQSLFGNYYFYKVLNLISPAIVNYKYPELGKYCTYVMEDIPYALMGKDFKPAFKKNTSLIFSKSVISEYHETIKIALQGLLETIKQESYLIQDDNLAKGSLIESVQTSAHYKKNKDDKAKGSWNVNSENLAYPFSDNNQAEYWGDLGLLYQSDFIAGASKYPWMPSDISNNDSLF
ncbi:TPA: hypothetical protein ACU9KK_001285 [Legionella anisa]|nr:hypothetical protein [Legionella anisa]MCW8426324.1 hypothetical protein [Legionella anisa]MCW8447984.1 hypothetical protein [Legionella anisa]UAK78614.1 hypothetical protein K8O89_13205 [Legionella anisa]